MKHYAIAFLLGCAAAYLAVAVFIDPALETLIPIAVVIALALGAAQWRSPSKPMPTWWIYASGFLPLATALPIFALVAVALRIEEGKKVSDLHARDVSAAVCAVLFLGLWILLYSRGRISDENRANQRPDGTSAKAPPSKPSQGAAGPHP